MVRPFRAKLLSRLGWFLLFAPPTTVITLSTTLTPNPAGHGTHTQLGLPPCGFYTITGLPCPGCGLTTCFSHMVRAEVIDAAWANPFGVMLFMVSTACAITAFIGLVTGMPVLSTLDRLRADRLAILLAVGAILVWSVRVATQLWL
jgi:hypothetical protein